LFHIKTFPPKGEPFELGSISSVAPPQGADGRNWRRYVITQGESAIVGYRQGTQQSVTLAIEEIVVQLNERRVGKSGRTHLTLSPKKKT
jgi:hypothetical protein